MATFTRSVDWHAGGDEPPPGAPGAGQRPASAADRLRATRARLRQALLADGTTLAHAEAGAPDDGNASTFAPDPPTLMAQLMRVLRNAVADGIAGRPASAIVGDAAVALVGPTARHHPVALVSAAAATGAAIALLRPWRWGHPMQHARHLDAARPQRGMPAVLVGVLAAVPIGTWLALLQWTMHRAEQARPQPPDEGARHAGDAS